MGTRNLTMVVCNGQTKVAQYGQWDGYPSGQGETVLTFLKKAKLDKFKKQVEKLTWLTDEQVDMVNKCENWTIEYPYLSRDAGADILNAIHYGKMEIGTNVTGKRIIPVKIIGLQNKEGFAGDSLFCEWAYVIDLDKNVLEVYSGFNKEPLTETDRFFNVETDSKEYNPIKIVKSYPLDNLPDLETFCNECDPKEE